MKKKNFGGLGLALALVFGSGVGISVQAQTCPEGTTVCANQTIARNPTAAYQLNPFAKVKKVLLYDIAPGHLDGKRAWRRAMVRMAQKYGFELVITDAAIGYITPVTLTGVDVVVFSEGDKDVLGGGDASVSSVAMQNFIYRDGHAMLMVHAAAAFITCPGTGNGGGGANIDAASCLFMARAVARQYLDHRPAGTRARVYGDSVLAGTVPPFASTGYTPSLPPTATMNHGRVNVETKNIFNNTIPFNWALPPNSPTDSRTYVWDGFGDEWYWYYNNPGPRAIPEMIRTFNGVPYVEGKLNVLLSMDETSYTGSGGMGDHPQSWVRKMGNGLASYNNMGHDNVPFAGRTGDGRTGNDSVATAYSWNLIRYLARDYVGCMDNKYAEFNPAASVTTMTATDDPAPCKTLVTSISNIGSKNSDLGIKALAGSIEISMPDAGSYQVYIFDLSGREVFSRSVIGGSSMKVNVGDLGKGSYFVRMSTPKNGLSVTRVNLD